MRIRYKILASLLGLAVAYFAVHVFRIIFLTAGMKGTCPNCGAVYIRQSTQRPLADLPFRIFGLVPYRCMICDLRFQRTRIRPVPKRGKRRGKQRGKKSKGGKDAHGKLIGALAIRGLTHDILDACVLDRNRPIWRDIGSVSVLVLYE